MQRIAYERWVGGLAVALGVGAAAIGVGCGIAAADTGASSAAGARPLTSEQKPASNQRKIVKPAAAQERIATKAVPKATSLRLRPAGGPLALQTTQPTVAQAISGFIQTAIGAVFNNFLRITQGPPRLPPAASSSPPPSPTSTTPTAIGSAGPPCSTRSPSCSVAIARR